MFLYKILNIILTPFTVILLVLRRIKGKEEKKRFLEKLGYTKEKRKQTTLLWFHAASIGESLSILPIIKILCQNKKFQILITSGTTTSAKILKQKLPENVIHQYAPIENYFAIKRFLKHWQPSLAIFVESEFWPLIIECTSKRCKIISLNTSISDRSFKSWNKFSKIKQSVFEKISLFIPKSLQDEKKLRLLGVNNTKYLGNIKFCSPPLQYDRKNLATLKKQIANRHVVLFASTHVQENHVIFEIYHHLKKITKSNFLFIVVPRHPTKLQKFKTIIKKQKIKHVFYSQKKQISDDTTMYVVDTLGVLGTFFKLSPITIMGGTFEKIGGHNIIEPSQLGSIVINGPYDYSIAEMSKEFVEKKALLKVHDSQECSILVNDIFSTPLKYQKYSSNAQKIIKEKQSILEEIINIIENEL